MADNNAKYYKPSQKAAVSKYNQNAYDEIKIRVKKGKKALIQKCAEHQGMSTNAFIVESIEEAAHKAGFDLTVRDKKGK